MNQFKLAVSFLTRIPVNIVEYSDDKLNQATGYFGIVGALIGAILGCVYLLTHTLFSSELAIVLTIISGFLLTGGFHEDGLADVADGFGGAFERSKKLNIMKDSRLGTYGTLALISLFALKYQLLVSAPNIVIALIIAHSLSRILATSIIGHCPYVTDDEQSKVKPVAHTLPSGAKSQLTITAVIALLFLWTWQFSLLDIVLLSVTCLLARHTLIEWFKHHIGGYTGDCLGAAQQLFELLIYCLFIILLD